MTDPYYQDERVTLYHGDCLELADLWTCADVLVTDPPYGSGGMAKLYGRVPSDAGRGRVIASDETAEARDAVLALWAERPVLCFGTPRMAEPPGGWDHRLVWDKREPGLNGGPWRYNHESIFVRGEGWVRVNARSFSVISVPSGNGTPEKADHVHAKPVALMRSLIAAAPPGTIADPFAGSGSTGVAAKALGRRAILVELEERFCEIAARRLAQDVLDFDGSTPA
ncbi:MAG: site-specific DNA-methyltransferase [Phycicoccus sp.]|nr:site-specific DNA-methyltransferase [Phycicoccus sp.]